MQEGPWNIDDILAEAQVWVRRLACIGFAVVIVAEVITGKVCTTGRHVRISPHKPHSA